MSGSFSASVVNVEINFFVVLEATKVNESLF